MKKLCCVFLCLAMGTTLFCSCKKETTKPAENTSITTTAAQESIVAEISDNLPEKDFNGYQFRFFARDCDASHAGGLYQTEETGDVVNDAVFQRNKKVEERFNIVITKPVLGPDGVPTNLINSILAGDDIVDVVMPHFRYLGDMALQGQLVDLKKVPYIDFDQPWWTKNLIENYSIFDKSYVALGDIGIDNITYTGCLFFNKQLMSEYVPENLYDVVRSGGWTMDKMLETIKYVGTDINGDGAAKPEDDRYGFMTAAGFMFMFQYGANQPTTVRDADGIPVLSINTDKMTNIVEKAYSITHEYQYSYVANELSDNAFVSGRCFMKTGLLSDAVSASFREMKDDYGVLPFPKYDETQDQYYSHASAHGSLIGIPVTNTDLERTGIILEAMVAEGYKIIRPAVYDVALKTKTARDDDSSEMMDIILKGRTGDFADIYDEWGLVYTLDHIVGRSNSKDFASFYAKNEKATLTRLNKAVSAFEEMKN